MNIRAKASAAVLSVLGFMSLFSLLSAEDAALPRGPGPRGLGSLPVLQDAYRKWSEEHAETGRGDTLVLGLGWSKAFSEEITRAHGTLSIDLRRGDVTAVVEGLDGSGADLWLVDNRSAPGASDLPEPGDALLPLGRLLPSEKGVLRLNARLDPSRFQGFEADLAVVTRPGQSPVRRGLLYGHTSLFQKLYSRSRATAYPARRSPMPAPLRLPGLLSLPESASLQALIDQGEDLFFHETFGGNGRTCGTCHPAENNFTLDPEFIAGLPPDDPLFVFERNPALAGLERPDLLRRLGLIVVNADGFDDPTRKLVLRSVSHTLALRTSLAPSPLVPGTSLPFDDSTVPPVQRTGWSGDGAPGSGTLLEFSLGAVTQHSPRTLARVPGIDFRVPATEELEALEAFQLSLGRQSDPELFTLTPREPGALEGLFIFLNGDPGGGLAAGKCVQCHSDGGASSLSTQGLPSFNGVFDAGHERIPNQPARLIDPGLPLDGGFGTAEACDLDGDGSPDPGVFGNCAFNVPPLVEAADTGPFFHHHAARTLEEAIAFYSSEAFNASPPARRIGEIRLTPADEAKIAAFLRVLNALENIRQAQDRQARALTAGAPGKAVGLLTLAASDCRDAAEVLAASSLHPEAAARLRLSVRLLELAAAGAIPVDTAVEKAARLEARARSLIVVE